MKKIPQRLSALRVLTALFLTALLLCGCLTGCGRDKKDKENGDGGKTDTTPVVSGGDTKPEDTSHEPKASTAQELWDKFKEDIEGIQTYRDLHPASYPLQTGATDPDPARFYTQDFIDLKATVLGIQTTIPAANDLLSIIGTLDNLLTRVDDANAATEKEGLQLTPNKADLQGLFDTATRLKTELNIQSGGEGGNNETDTEIAEIKSALKTLQSDMGTLISGMTGIESNVNTVKTAVEKIKPPVISPVITALCSALCLVAVAFGFFLMNAKVSQLEESVSKATPSGGASALTDEQKKAVAHAQQAAQTEQTAPVVQLTAEQWKALLAYITETQTLQKQLRQQLNQEEDEEDAGQSASAARQAPAARKVSMFVWDRQKGLNEVASRGEFSGEPTGAPGEFRIWPDPREMGEQSQSQQTVNRNFLYFDSVKEFFNITPPSVGNSQYYSIQVKECAVIRKDYGQHYVLARKGQIQAKGVS